MESDFEVLNVGQLVKDLKGIEDKLTKKKLVEIIRPGAKQLQQEVKSQAPKRTGTLRSAIRIKVGRGKTNAPSATIQTYLAKTYQTKKGKKVKPYYAWFVHQGTVAHHGKRKHRKPRLYSGLEELAYLRQRMTEGSVRIKPNPFVARAFDAKVDEVAATILNRIAKSVEQ